MAHRTFEVVITTPRFWAKGAENTHETNEN
jgi:hypothetical protein